MAPRPLLLQMIQFLMILAWLLYGDLVLLLIIMDYPRLHVQRLGTKIQLQFRFRVLAVRDHVEHHALEALAKNAIKLVSIAELEVHLAKSPLVWQAGPMRLM